MTHEDVVEWAIGAVAVALLGCAVLGIRGCVAYNRQQEVACRKAGGEIVSPTSGSYTGCYRLTGSYEHVQVTP